MHKELSVLVITLNCIIIIFNSFIHFLKCVVAASKSIWNSGVSFFLFWGFILCTEVEIFDGFMVLFGVKFTEPSSKVAFRKFRIDFYWFVKISNCKLMVSHILVYSSTGNENSFIIRNFEQHSTMALESFLELIGFMIHETKMESATHKILL